MKFKNLQWISPLWRNFQSSLLSFLISIKQTLMQLLSDLTQRSLYKLQHILTKIKVIKHNRCVVFTTNSALILNNPWDWEKIKHYANVIQKPDLSRVVKVPPRYWKIEDGVIMQMAEDERMKRDQDIEFAGRVDKAVRCIDHFAFKRRSQKFDIKTSLWPVYAIIALVTVINLFFYFK